MRHLPHVSVRIGERSRCAAPVGYSCVTNDRPSGLEGFVQDVGHFLGQVHVVRQLDPGSTVASESSPQSKNHAANLEKAHLVIGLLRARPAESFIEAAGSGEI